MSVKIHERFNSDKSKATLYLHLFYGNKKIRKLIKFNGVSLIIDNGRDDAYNNKIYAHATRYRNEIENKILDGMTPELAISDDYGITYFKFSQTVLRQYPKKNTIKNFKLALNNFKDFLHDRKLLVGGDLDFQLITPHMCHEFKFYLESLLNKEGERRISPNTIERRFGILKIVYNQAIDMEVIEFQRNPFSKVKHDRTLVNIEYLEWDEIERLYNLDLTDYIAQTKDNFRNNSKIGETLTLFIISCLTGMRFADVIIFANTLKNNKITIYKDIHQKT